MSAFAVLALEAIRDAVRRRIAVAVAAVSLLSLLFVDACTTCTTAQLHVDGELRQLTDVAGFAGATTFLVLALWCVVLAGVLAADLLAEALDDGTAALCLARPVGRASFALARLVGALAVAGATALLLLGVTAGLLYARGDLPLAPALVGGLAAAAGSIVAAALAMAASLAVPRLVTVLFVFAGVGTVALANLVGLLRPAAGASAEGILAAIDRFGPPLLTSLALALAPWMARVELSVDPLEIALRLVLWTAGGVALLILAFRRIELGR
jgi:ABC-type transport system involved in multi-copper enzyme maturation permease subunit